MFQRSAPVERLTEVSIETPLYKKQWSQNDKPLLKKTSCTWEDAHAVITKKDCIKIAMEMVLGTGTKANANFSQVYDDFVLIRHPMTVEDVCNMVLTSGVSMNVVDKQNNLVYKFDFGHKMPQLSLAIDTSKMHANVVKLLTITEVDNSGIGGII
jgi:hypothetical protein